MRIDLDTMFVAGREPGLLVFKLLLGSFLPLQLGCHSSVGINQAPKVVRAASTTATAGGTNAPRGATGGAQLTRLDGETASRVTTAFEIAQSPVTAAALNEAMSAAQLAASQAQDAEAKARLELQQANDALTQATNLVAASQTKLDAAVAAVTSATSATESSQAQVNLVAAQAAAADAAAQLAKSKADDAAAQAALAKASADAVAAQQALDGALLQRTSQDATAAKSTADAASAQAAALASSLVTTNQAVAQAASTAQTALNGTPAKNVRTYGAKGDGTTDDTAAFQAALNALGDYESLYVPSGTYPVKNLVLPTRQNISIYAESAILKAVPGGDPDYLLASYKYVNNVAESDKGGVSIRGLIFEGQSTVTNALVLQSWNSTIEKCEFRNAANGIKITAETQNGTRFPTSTLVNNKVNSNWIHNCTNYGIWVRDPARNKCTDYFIENNLISSCLSGTVLEASAGTLVTGNHFYSNTSGDLRVSIAGKGLRIESNYFEDASAITVSDFLANTALVISGNTSNGLVSAGSVSSGAVLNSNGNSYIGTSGALSLTNTSNLICYSSNDVFETATPFRAAGTLSTFIASRSVSSGLGTNRMLDGIQKQPYLTRTIEYGSQTPVSGNYNIGDKVINTQPASGIIDWVVTAAGPVWTPEYTRATP